MNDGPIRTYPILGEITDKRKQNKTTTTTFLSNLKLFELLKTDKIYSNLPLKLFVNNNENTITLKFMPPWKFLASYKDSLIDIILQFNYADLATNVETRHNCLDAIIKWLTKYLLRLEHLQSIIPENSYLSIFAVWDYIYGLVNFNGSEILSILLNNQDNENEITSYLANLVNYEYEKERSKAKDGFQHFRSYRYITEITVNMSTRMETRLLSLYDVYWSLINLNANGLQKQTERYQYPTNPYTYIEILENYDISLLNKNNSIISLNFYDHFNHTHFHSFENLHEFKLYMLEKIYKNWNARLLTVPTEHDRLYYGVISNLEIWLLKNQKYDPEYYDQQRRIFKCLHILQGLFPIMYTKPKPYPEFVKLIQMILRDQIVTNQLLALYDASFLQFNKFPMLLDMFNFLRTQKIYRMSRYYLIGAINHQVVTVYNIKSFDTMQYKFKISQIGYPHYNEPVGMLHNQLITELKPYDFKFNLWADDINSFYTLNFPEHGIPGPDVTDEAFVENIKYEYRFRELYKNAFRVALKPENLLRTTGYHDSGYSFSSFDKIIMQSYCYKENVNYLHIAPEGVDVTVRDGDLNIHYNLSTLKLLQAFCYVAYNATNSWEFLTQQYNILILGAVTEPLVDVLRRLSNNQYIIDAMGREAFYPYLRADLEDVIISKNYHFVISDIDQTDTDTVDEISNKFTNHLIRVDSLASLGCIVKCNYLLESIVNQINAWYTNKPLFQYKLMHSGASTIGSYEIFFCGFGHKLRDIVIPISIPRMYKAYSGMPELRGNPIFFKQVTEFPTDILWFRNENLYNGGGDVYSFLCHQNDLKNVLGTMLSMSQRVNYGNTDYGKDNTLIRVSGVTNYSRMTFTKLVGNFGIPNETNFVKNGGFYPTNDNLIIKTASPGKSFGYGQRLMCLIMIRYLSQNVVHNIQTFIDIGCRDFESILLANALPRLVNYTGYDMTPTTLNLPDHSRVHFINRKVTKEALINMINENDYCLLVVYNSMFMAGETKVDLQDLLHDVLSAIGESLKHATKECILAFTFYLCEPDGINEYKQIGTIKEEHDGIYFTLDRGQPVATLTLEEWNNLIRQSEIPPENINYVHTSKELIYYGCAMHGYAPSQKSLTLNYLYNSCQPLVIINY